MRVVLSVWLSVASSLAPMQCQSELPAEQRRYEHPPEALYELAQRLEAEGETKAWRMTLQTIIDRYPNSREAVMAKDDLSGAEGQSDPRP